MKNKRNSVKIAKRREPINIFTGVYLGVIILYALVLCALLLWAFLAAFKDVDEFELVNSYGIPNSWSFDNFTKVLTQISVPIYITQNGTSTRANVGILLQLIYSILYSVGGAFLLAFVPCCVAYLTSKFRYKFSKFLDGFVIVAMIIPIIGSEASTLSLLRSIGLFDNLWGFWILKFHFLGMYYLVYQAVFRGVSKDYSEAAELDGASQFVVMFRIVLPMVKTMIFTVFIIRFIEMWNDYQTPMLYLPSYPTLAYGLYYMTVVNKSSDIRTTTRIAGSIMLAIPVLVLFICFKERLIGNLSLGGVKE